MALDADPTINTKWKKSDAMNNGLHDRAFGCTDMVQATQKFATN
jgi:hypothetical protein